MAPVHSTIPAVRSAIKTIADTAISGVQVTFGDAGEQGRTENVRLGPTVLADFENVSIKTGRRRLKEEYVVSLIIEVMSKTTPESSETRAFAIAEDVEDAIALDHTLGGVDNLHWCVMDGIELETDETAERPRTVLELRLRCVAQLGRV